MDELILAMKKALANEFAFYLKTHGFHWNVEGQDFPQLHELFGKIYNDTYDSLDTFAEHIRVLDAYAPASFTRFIELSDLEDEIKILTAGMMLDKLLSDTAIVINSLETAYELAEASHAHGLSNFLAERIDSHAKWAWQLRATLKDR